MAYKGPPKVQKVMVQPINLIFRYLQNRSRVQIWLYENVNLRIEGHIVGFDEYMNIVLDDAEEVHMKTKNRKQIGRIMMKGDNITLIQNVNPNASVETLSKVLGLGWVVSQQSHVVLSVPGGKSASSFMERCIAFIGDNAPECVKTNAFLNLPKEALIKLISSDFLCLEEEEVWRCVLAWAKQRAGVTQPTAHWAEEERARVCHHLAPLMQHVRLLLIDSAVFAEEVEPTGAVPMELSLERYRRAALHSAPRPAPRPDPDKRTQPRLAVNLFAGSAILQQDKSAFQSLINTWCGSPKQSWRLVFRASAHAFSAHAFHAHCDGVAPVLLLVQLQRGEVIGGYCEAGWAAGGAGGYVSAERAMLFSLAEPPARYPLLKKPFALCHHPDCGPIFGAGADLLVSHQCNANSDSYSNLHSYGDAAPAAPTAPPASLAPDYNFTVREYELFTCAP
ncbi:putative small nuclear ribonucleoprotein E [Papilio xuthus]|uniref:Small nuclear ribonucleoprotein E n=3 Tax=Papilio TaxID=7145 RepID=A0A194Q9J2_PAPXU|nr:putative small nuclear ribonucleoprotein E [Papilio xuthus]